MRNQSLYRWKNLVAMEFKIEKILEYSDLFPHEVKVDVPAVLKIQ